MASIEWMAFFVLLVSALAAGAAVTVSNLAVTREICLLKQTYRWQKSLELEQIQARLIDDRRDELARRLEQNGAWRNVVHQILADAFPDGASRDVGEDGWITPVDVSGSPPAFTVARQDESGSRFTFTTASDRPRWRRREPAVPVDASLSPTARIEVEAVWRHLAEGRGLDPQAVPRMASWHLVRQVEKPKAKRRIRCLR